MTRDEMTRDDPPNLDKIIKLMGMTGSSHDPEAISALRMATELLKKWGWTWDEILRGKIKIMPDPFTSVPMPTVSNGSGRSSYAAAPPPPPPPKQYDNRDEIEKYFEKLSFKKLPRDVNTRIASIERSWNANGYLIYKDYDFIRTTANSRRRY